MNKVLIIGSGGAGKSTLAKNLAQLTNLPLIHLDAEYWRAGWQATPTSEWSAKIAGLCASEHWIMDGNYGGTLEQRLQACDTVIFLDRSRWLCLWRVINRAWRYRGTHRPDMAEGCHEQVTWEFLRWIWDYPQQKRPRILARLADLGENQRVLILRSDKETQQFLKELDPAKYS